MNIQEPQQSQTPAAKPANNPLRSLKTFFVFMICFAAVGLFFIASALLNPHKTAVVVDTGRISTYTSTTGRGRHRAEHTRYKADVKVRVKDTSEIVTVYYRVRSPESIPSNGDEIQFANSMLVGNTPYPQMWAVWTGVVLTGVAAILYVGYLIARYRKSKKHYAF